MGRLVWSCWVGVTLMFGTYLAVRFVDGDRAIYLPGKTTHGHYQIELDCQACHSPFAGIREQACIDCHGDDLKLANDSHPKSKFTDPRNAQRSTLEAALCVTCHREHRPEVTSAMGVTLPDDFCYQCHSEIAKERPSHRSFAFDTCSSAGCHNFHDNTALYEDFLLKHGADPDLLPDPWVPPRTSVGGAQTPLTAKQHDAPAVVRFDPAVLHGWESTAHAQAGVNCTACHARKDESARWDDQPGDAACASCHAQEEKGFRRGLHGMRLAQNLSPMEPGMARLPMKPEARHKTLGCTSCHGAHRFDTRQAAFAACLTCHNDAHTLAYQQSAHFRLWEAERATAPGVGRGASCATCHLPREFHTEGGSSSVAVQHNQSFNLRPNEKMIRSVCMNCHGLRFSIDALADGALVQRNFNGRPSRHIESIDLANQRVEQSEK